MKVLIAGGRGFMGTALGNDLRAAGHEVFNLTRAAGATRADVHWDGVTPRGWAEIIEDMDAVINVTGYGLDHWPWTASRKRRFVDSRVAPGHALAAAIAVAAHRPHVFVQISGVNYYGLRGHAAADEGTAAANDFLARLTVDWEAATGAIEAMGVRRVVARSGIVLDRRGGLLPLMALPVRLFIGGRLGEGKQAVPWIHVADQVRALRFLLENGAASGPYNLVAPQPTSSDRFMRALATALNRPYWLPTPAFFLRAVLGEMGTLVLEGRVCKPRRLQELGYTFKFGNIDEALRDLVGKR